jgi:hypothetical protein
VRFSCAASLGSIKIKEALTAEKPLLTKGLIEEEIRNKVP